MIRCDISKCTKKELQCRSLAEPLLRMIADCCMILRNLGATRHEATWYHHATLTHWGGVTHICVGKLTSIGSDNGLSPGRRQAIIWTNAGILLVAPPGINNIQRNYIIAINTFSLKKFIYKYRLENVGYLSRPQCVNGKMALKWPRQIHDRKTLNW